MWRRALADLRGVWLLQSLLRMRGESGRRECLMQLSRMERIVKSRWMRSCSLRLYKQLDGLTANLSISIDARMVVIRGSALHHIVKMSIPIHDSFVKTMAANRLYKKARSLGEEVNANAAVHLQYSDDRKPTGAQPASRLAI